MLNLGDSLVVVQRNLHVLHGRLAEATHCTILHKRVQEHVHMRAQFSRIAQPSRRSHTLRHPTQEGSGARAYACGIAAQERVSQLLTP